MKKSRYTYGQIIAVRKLQQARVPTAEQCRRHGIGEVTLCKWQSRYGAMQVFEARRLKRLAHENRKLEKLLAKEMLDVATPRGHSEKTSEARIALCLLELGRGAQELLAASGLSFNWHGSQDLSLQVAAPGRSAGAGPTEGPG